MELLDSFDARRIAKNRREYEVLIQTRASMLKDVNLTDVGFGVSQVLPVVVGCFYPTPGSTVIMEQPELHLHPRVQANMADLFIDAIHAREDYTDRRIQLIVESHSEHLLRRIQRGIAEKELSNDEVALYFCEAGPWGSNIRPLDIDVFGNIRNWPEDFFGDEIADLAAMTDATMRRRREEGG